MAFIPNDIFKEVAKAFNPNDGEDLRALQQMRLVCKAFNNLSTPVLLRGVETFDLGSSFEHMIARTEALATSTCSRYLNFKHLKISRKAIVPRFNLEQDLPCEENHTSISRRIEQCKVQVEKVLRNLKPVSRFRGVIVGDALDSTLSNGRFEYTIERFIPLAAELVNMLEFTAERQFTGHLFASDLCRFMLSNDVSGPMITNRQAPVSHCHFREGMVDFVSGVRSIDIAFLADDGIEWTFFPEPDFQRIPKHSKNIYMSFADSMALGKIVRFFNVTSLSLQYPTIQRKTFMSLFSSRDTLVPSMKTFSLAGSRVEPNAQLYRTLQKFTNLTSITLRDIQLGGSCTWSDSRRGPFGVLAEMENLVSIFFEGLTYSSMDFFISQHDSMDEIYNQTTGKRYRLPIITYTPEDIDSFLELRRIVEQRRLERSLAKDPWLSVFCLSHEVIAALRH